MEQHILKIIRGTLVDFTDNPLEQPDALRYYPDGAIALEGGYIVALGTYAEVRASYPNAPCDDFTGKLILPGFIDTHLHFPQIQIIGSYGKKLLDWLNDYTFPAEEVFANPDHCARMANHFIQELFRNGTTSCMAYATVHKESAEALFCAASAYNMRIITGKVLMNRNAPEALTDTTAQAEVDTIDLITRWHNTGRNRYAITPRFAISCDQEELEMAGRLHARYPDTYIQTHLSENKDEVELVRKLFTKSVDYLNVYELAGLLTDRTVFGHGIHLTRSEMKRIAEAGAAIAHCPSSNLFLGSGLFPMKVANDYRVTTSIATDVGAGTSFSLLRTLGDAYKVQQLNGFPMTAPESFYKITLGAAKALRIDELVGNFGIGKEADLVVIDYTIPQPLALRKEQLEQSNRWDIEKLLFGLQTLGDDRNVCATYVLGEQVYIKH